MEDFRLASGLITEASLINRADFGDICAIDIAQQFNQPFAEGSFQIAELERLVSGEIGEIPPATVPPYPGKPNRELPAIGFKRADERIYLTFPEGSGRYDIEVDADRVKAMAVELRSNFEQAPRETGF